MDNTIYILKGLAPILPFALFMLMLWKRDKQVPLDHMKTYFYNCNGDPLNNGIITFQGKSQALDDNGGILTLDIDSGESGHLKDSKGELVMSWAGVDNV